MPTCLGCIQGKQHRLPFKSHVVHRAIRPLSLVHSDLCGPFGSPAYGSNALFMVTFTDDFTRYSIVYLVQRKSEVIDCFRRYIAWAERITGQKILAFRTDNGGEYVSHELRQLLQAQGIQHWRTAPYTPEQNGVAERLNRTIVESARSMLQARNLPYGYWGFAVETANYLKNRLPTKAVIGKTPYEAWTGTKPDLKHLQIFGCNSFVHVPDVLRTKLQTKSTRCIFVGYYEDSTSCVKCFNPKTGLFYRVRDVTCTESDTTVGAMVLPRERPVNPSMTVNSMPVLFEQAVQGTVGAG